MCCIDKFCKEKGRRRKGRVRNQEGKVGRYRLGTCPRYLTWVRAPACLPPESPAIRILGEHGQSRARALLLRCRLPQKTRKSRKAGRRQPSRFPPPTSAKMHQNGYRSDDQTTMTTSIGSPAGLAGQVPPLQNLGEQVPCPVSSSLPGCPAWCFPALPLPFALCWSKWLPSAAASVDRKLAAYLKTAGPRPVKYLRREAKQWVRLRRHGAVSTHTHSKKGTGEKKQGSDNQQQKRQTRPGRPGQGRHRIAKDVTAVPVPKQ